MTITAENLPSLKPAEFPAVPKPRSQVGQAIAEADDYLANLHASGMLVSPVRLLSEAGMAKRLPAIEAAQQLDEEVAALSAPDKHALAVLAKRNASFHSTTAVEGAARFEIFTALLPVSPKDRVLNQLFPNRPQNIPMRPEYHAVSRHVRALQQEGLLGVDPVAKQIIRDDYVAILTRAFERQRLANEGVETDSPDNGLGLLLRRAAVGTVIASSLFRGPIASAMPLDTVAQRTPTALVIETSQPDVTVPPVTVTIPTVGDVPSTTVDTAAALETSSLQARLEALQRTPAELEKIATLTPEMQERAVQILEAAKEEGLELSVISGNRSPMEQAQIYTQGRTQEQINAKADELDALDAHNLARILRTTPAQAGVRATEAGPGQSNHNYAQAMDVAIFNEDGTLAASSDERWQRYGAIIARIGGMEWGGVWEMRDMGHVQMAGLNWREDILELDAQYADWQPGQPDEQPAFTEPIEQVTALPAASMDLLRQGLVGEPTATVEPINKVTGRPETQYRPPMTREQVTAAAIVYLEAVAAAEQLPRGDGSSIGRLFEEHAQQFADSAEALGITIEQAVGVFATESSAESYGPDGRTKIRVEVDDLNERFHLGLVDIHADNQVTTQDQEYEALEAARQALRDAGMDETLAYQWTSWGGPQIMGFHWQELGYRDVYQMMETYQSSESAMIRDFFVFVSHRPEAVAALQNGDYATFGGIYNGSRAYGDDLQRNVNNADEAID